MNSAAKGVMKAQGIGLALWKELCGTVTGYSAAINKEQEFSFCR